MEILGFPAGPYQTNCYLVVHEGAVTIIDPGMHTQGPIEGYLEEHSLRVEKIILTHGHIDHTRDAGSLAAKFRAPVYVHSADAFMLEKGEGVSPESQILFDAFNMTPISDLRELRHGETIEIGGIEHSILHAPGHSPGSVLLQGEEYCFVGDVVFKGSIGRTDLPQSSPEDMTQTLKTVVWSLPDTLTLLPGHGPATTMAQERVTNPFIKQAMA